jgi:hypothetical protein
MTDGPNSPPDGYGFDADGRPVRVVWDDNNFDDPPPETDSAAVIDAGQLLDLLIDGARDHHEIASRAAVLAMLMKRPSAPQTMAEFALLVDMPRTSAQRYWARVFQCLKGGFGDFWAP